MWQRINLTQHARHAHGTAYHWLLRASLGIGALTFVGGLLWLVGGAGIYGSPVAGAWSPDPLTGQPQHWAYWIFWVVVAGPLALLPCALVEWRWPRVGAIALAMAALLVAECGIRSGRNVWGYASDDALIVLGFMTLPMLLLASALFLIGPCPPRRRGAIAWFLIGMIAMAGLALRFVAERDAWGAGRAEVTDVVWVGAFSMIAAPVLSVVGMLVATIDWRFGLAWWLALIAIVGGYGALVLAEAIERSSYNLLTLPLIAGVWCGAITALGCAVWISRRTQRLEGSPAAAQPPEPR